MTSKELARKLGLSEAAVSLALNNKPGVSTTTRNRVKAAAEAAGLELAGMSSPQQAGVIYLVYFRRHGAVLADTSFFSELTEGVERGCSANGYRVNILNVYQLEDLQRTLDNAHAAGVAGVILFGTEMREEDFATLDFSRLPIVLLDNHCPSATIDSVQINNLDGAFLATDYLIKQCKQQPGYLKSAYPIMNFAQRTAGFRKAITYNGMSKSSAIIHELTPSIEGACDDMLEILSSGDKLAACYFADNDLIAIGAIKAFKAKGYRIPQDISVLGFDDIAMCDYTEPALTTIHVPKCYMGLMAAERLVYLIKNKSLYPVNIQVATHLVIRNSITSTAQGD
ncbi:MAG: LacI family transcriptional regulator [Clostridiaceae bacterium]|nr:LacI family transcriptional regulator [Clostridiaceae bacterium]